MSIQQTILFDGWNIPTIESFHPISTPITKQEKTFAGWQEAAQKDVEHAFGVLQSKWQLLVSPVEMWDEVCIQDMLTSYIILYNMMVEQQLEGGEECMGDYFEEGLPQDHNNHDSNTADEAEDRINMLEVESHGNDRRCNMTKWNISTYNKRSYRIWSRGSWK